MFETAPCWYVAYGSNMEPAALERYLSGAHAPEKSRRVRIDRGLYFAGASKAWGASVAFVTLNRTSGEIDARAFLITVAALAPLIRGENGLEFNSAQVVEAMTSLRPGEHASLPLTQDAEGYRGKYNALLRLDDIEGIAAYTVTTERILKRGNPAPEYLRRIQQARLLP